MHDHRRGPQHINHDDNTTRQISGGNGLGERVNRQFRHGVFISVLIVVRKNCQHAGESASCRNPNEMSG